MNLRQYLITMGLATLLCWSAWGVVVFNVDPFQSGLVGFVFFYISFFFALLGTCSIVFFFLHSYFARTPEPLFRYVQKSFQEASVVAIFAFIALYLQSRAWLNVWNSVILILTLTLLLSFNMSLRKTKPVTENETPHFTA